MKILAQFTGKVIKFNPNGLSRVQLTDLSNGNVCETDCTSEELSRVGVNSDGCDFEVIVTDENGKPKGVIRKVSIPDAPPSEIQSTPETITPDNDFNI